MATVGGNPNNNDLNENIHNIESAVQKLNKAFGEMFDNINDNLKATAVNVQRLATSVNSNNGTSNNTTSRQQERAQERNEQALINSFNRLIEDTTEDARANIQGGRARAERNRTSQYRTTIRQNTDEIERLRNLVANGQITQEEVQDRLTELAEGIERARRSINDNSRGRTQLLNSLQAYGRKFLAAFTSGASDYFAAYESTFTSVASKMGTNYSETRKTYYDLVYSIDSLPKSTAINIAKDLVPALNEAASKGLTGEKALTKAYSDALDKKIMPWLTTNSESYVNLFANLSTNELNQIKNQQLQLQKTEAGNRILQTQADTLLNDFAPMLLNIEGYVGGQQDLGELQSVFEQLVKNGYSTSEAYSYVRDMSDAIKNPYSAITGGSTSKKLFSLAFSRGSDLVDAYNMSYGWANEIAGNLIKNGQYYAAGALTNATGSTAGNIEMTAGFGGFLSEYTGATEDLYGQAEKLANEYTTITQKFTNWLNNASTQVFSWITGVPYGDEFYSQVLGYLRLIINAIYTNSLTNFFGGGRGAGRNILGNLLGGGYQGQHVAGGFGRLFSTGGAHVAGGGIGLGQLLASGAITAGGLVAAYDGINKMGTNSTGGVGSRSASGVQAALGIAASVAVLAGAGTGVGLAFLAAAGAAKCVANALDKTSATVGEVEQAFKNEKEIIESLSNSEEKRDYLVEKGVITQEEANKYTDKAIQNLIDYETSSEKLNKDKADAQAKYEQNSRNFLDKVNNLENQGRTDAVYDLLKTAGATEKQLQDYLGGESAERILTSKKLWGIFGDKSLLQGASTSDWEKLNSIAGSYATGLAYVPKDETVKVHKGERILTAEENSAYTKLISTLANNSYNLATNNISSSNNEEDEMLADVIRQVTKEIISAIREGKTNFTLNSNTKTISRSITSYDQSAVHLTSSLDYATF